MADFTKEELVLIRSALKRLRSDWISIYSNSEFIKSELEFIGNLIDKVNTKYSESE